MAVYKLKSIYVLQSLVNKVLNWKVLNRKVASGSLEMSSKAFDGNVLNIKITSGGLEMCSKVLLSNDWYRQDLNGKVASGSLNMITKVLQSKVYKFIYVPQSLVN